MKVAKFVLFIYLGVIGTFQLSHYDFVPLDSGRSISAANPFANSLDVINGHHICPAELFAQSTASPGIVAPRIFVQESLTFLAVGGQAPGLFRYTSSHSTRAPPQA